MIDDEEFLTMTDLISHEFKTPLAIIRSNISNIERRYEEGNTDSMDIRMATTAIRYCCNSLSRLSNNMSIVSGKRKIAANRYYYDVAEQIGSLCFIVNELFNSETVKVNFTAKTEPAVFNADPELITGMLLNLISNGIKYNASQEKLIDITLEIKNKKMIISVKDNGIGFPKEDAEKIFDIYYRSDNRSVMMATGLGLGLYIVREEVRAHNGTITARTTNKGTVFKIEIPDNSELVLRSPHRVYVSKDSVELMLSDELMRYV